MKNSLKLVGLSLFTLTTVRCTTLDMGGRDQYVKVSTQKPGAEIRSEGQLLGVTPAIIKLHRQSKPVIELNYLGQAPQSVHLPTEYRYARSLLGGLIFGIGAPIAWYIDWKNGTAYDIFGVKDFALAAPPGTKQAPEAQKTIAIAPPLATDRLQSDFAAEKLEGRIKDQYRPPQWQVLNFAGTEQIFYEKFYDYNNRPEPREMTKSYGELGVTHVADAEYADGKLEYTLTDIRTSKPLTSGELNVGVYAPTDQSMLKFSYRQWLAYMLPNSMSVDSSHEETKVSLYNREPIRSKDEPVDDNFGSFSRYLGSVGFTNLLPPNRSRTSHWFFRFAPALNFGYHKLHFNSPAAFFSESDFKIFRIGAGLGPEIAWQTMFGNFYASVTPGAAYSFVDYSSPVAGGSISRNSINLTLSAGYYFYFTGKWAFRISYRNISEDKKAWNEVLDRSQGFDIPVDQVHQTIVSTSICYYFPTLSKRISKK